MAFPAVKAFAVLAATLAVSAASAAGEPALDMTDQLVSSQNTAVVEKQSWWTTEGFDPNHTIANTFSGTWDINEYALFETQGYLDPVAAATSTHRHAWDWNPVFRCVYGSCGPTGFPSNLWGHQIRAPSPGLSVRSCFVEQARCFDPAPVYDPADRRYVYSFCGNIVYQDGDPALEDIPGSQALDGTYGRGAPSTVTVTVANPTGRRVRNILARWGVSSDHTFPYGCRDVPIVNHDYPFNWG